MDILTQHDIEEVTRRAQGDAISLYLPTHRSRQEIHHDAACLKNLLARVENELHSRGHAAKLVRSQLEPAAELLAKMEFRPERQAGLALLFSEGYFRSIDSPLAFEELAVVAPAFYVVPLVPLLGDRQEFHVLAVSQKHVRLLKGDRFGQHVVEVQGLPQNLVDALHYQPPERMYQASLFVRGPSGLRMRSVHGQGAPADFAKEEITEYFRMIEKVLHSFLRESQLPLVFAGVDYLFPIYREVNSYPHLADAHIHGSPDLMSDAELHKKAGEVLQAQFDRPRRNALERARQQAESGTTAFDLSSILPAAHQGRIETLLIVRGEREWGAFNTETENVGIHLTRRNDSVELLNCAAIETITHGGTVFLCAKDEMPSQAIVAAIYRWPATESAGSSSRRTGRQPHR